MIYWYGASITGSDTSPFLIVPYLNLLWHIFRHTNFFLYLSSVSPTNLWSLFTWSWSHVSTIPLYFIIYVNKMSNSPSLMQLSKYYFQNIKAYPCNHQHSLYRCLVQNFTPSIPWSHNEQERRLPNHVSLLLSNF